MNVSQFIYRISRPLCFISNSVALVPSERDDTNEIEYATVTPFWIIWNNNVMHTLFICMYLL